MSYLTRFAKRTPHQRESIRADQVRNSAGGFVFRPTSGRGCAGS